MKIPFKPLSLAALECFKQLFNNGPTWDGDIISKEGRKELIDAGLAFRVEGWASLTEDGVEAATMTSIAEHKIARKNKQ